MCDVKSELVITPRVRRPLASAMGMNDASLFGDSGTGVPFAYSNVQFPLDPLE